VQPILDFVPQRRAAQAFLNRVGELGAAVEDAVDSKTVATLSKIDLEKGLGFWKTMPTRRRSSTTSTSAP
jgi:hypothetical protein